MAYTCGMICVRVPNWLSHNLSPFHLTTSHSIFSLHKSNLFYHFVASQSQPWAPQFLVHDELRQPRMNEKPFHLHSPTLSEAHPYCVRPHNSVASDKLAMINSSHDRINSIALIYGSNIAFSYFNKYLCESCLFQIVWNHRLAFTAPSSHHLTSLFYLG